MMLLWENNQEQGVTQPDTKQSWYYQAKLELFSKVIP